MRGWFDLASACCAGTNPPMCREFSKKRLKGFEPSTFCMASRRSSQLSYIRTDADSSLIRHAVVEPALRSRYAGMRPDMRRFGNFRPGVPEIEETGFNRRVRAQRDPKRHVSRAGLPFPCVLRPPSAGIVILRLSPRLGHCAQHEGNEQHYATYCEN